MRAVRRSLDFSADVRSCSISSIVSTILGLAILDLKLSFVPGRLVMITGSWCCDGKLSKSSSLIRAMLQRHCDEKEDWVLDNRAAIISNVSMLK